ncbi:MAG: hypothetical protein ACOYLB_03245 [Phototrophicaceae bacterium]
MRVLRDLLKHLPNWDAPSKTALGIALALILLNLVVMIVSPSLRPAASAALLLLLLMLQFIALWGNRHLTKPITQAQRHYLRGAFSEVVALLQPLQVAQTASTEELTLLGNTYRQLGDLERSRLTLSEAIDKAPQHAFPLYGMGKTLMWLGEFELATSHFLRAEQADPQGVPALDVCEALYRVGRVEEARQRLAKVQPDQLRPEGWVMYRVLCYQLLGKVIPLDAKAVETGGIYWQEMLARFPKSSYSASLTDEMQAISKL